MSPSRGESPPEAGWPLEEKSIVRMFWLHSRLCPGSLLLKFTLLATESCIGESAVSLFKHTLQIMEVLNLFIITTWKLPQWRSWQWCASPETFCGRPITMKRPCGHHSMPFHGVHELVIALSLAECEKPFFSWTWLGFHVLYEVSQVCSCLIKWLQRSLISSLCPFLLEDNGKE